jgi:hypothetical protein
MDSNINHADNAVATMRALPSLATVPALGRDRGMIARSSAIAPVQIRGRAVSLSGEGSYRLGMDPISGMSSFITIDPAVNLSWGTCADHKFANRLGLSASPPV